MKKTLILAITTLLVSLHLTSKSQSVTKITVQDPVHPIFNNIIPNDIAFGGRVNLDPTIANKIIGYRYVRQNSSYALGLLGLQFNNTQLFSKVYINLFAPNNVFEIAKIAPVDWDRGTTYLLAGAVISVASHALPVILEIDRNTGAAVSYHLLNGFTIPDERFVPCDLQVEYGNGVTPTTIKILCIGRSPNAAPPSPKASIYLIDFNISANSYSVTRLVNNSNLNAYYDFPFNFVHSYHMGLGMYGDLSFYGLESNNINGINRGILYNSKNSTTSCKAFTLNNVSTANIQVNIPEDDIQSVAIQNSNQDIYLESNTFLSSINYQTSYRKNFSNPSIPFSLRGTSHGSKSQLNPNLQPIDFFLAQYQLPGFPLSGYSTFRYNYYTGTSNTTYNHDLDVDFIGGLSNQTPPSVYVNDYTLKYHCITKSIPAPSLPKFFYLIENDIATDQPSCTNTPAFNNITLPIDRSDVLFTSSVIATNLTPSIMNIAEVFSVPPPSLSVICSDNNSQPGSETSSISDLSLGGILGGSGSSGGGGSGGGGSTGRNVISNVVDELKIVQGSNFIRIDAEAKQIAHINIYNSVGQLLVKKQTNNPIIELSFKQTSNPSVYLIEAFFSDGSRKAKKIFY